MSVRKICLFEESLELFHKISKVGMRRSKSAAGFLQTHSPTLHYTFHETIGFFFCAVKFATMQIYLTDVTFRQFYLFSKLSGGTSDFLFTACKRSLGDKIMFLHLSCQSLCSQVVSVSRQFLSGCLVPCSIWGSLCRMDLCHGGLCPGSLCPGRSL